MSDNMENGKQISFTFSEIENGSGDSEKEENQFLWRQFCRLGEMMGDGLHHEPDGKWIEREYKHLARILIPELKTQDKERRKLKALNIDEQMQKLLLERKCSCGGTLKQSRSGSKVCYCTECNARYKARTKSKKEH